MLKNVAWLTRCTHDLSAFKCHHTIYKAKNVLIDGSKGWIHWLVGWFEGYMALCVCMVGWMARNGYDSACVTDIAHERPKRVMGEE